MASRALHGRIPFISREPRLSLVGELVNRPKWFVYIDHKKLVGRKQDLADIEKLTKS